jgi:hypothetical protein
MLFRLRSAWPWPAMPNKLPNRVSLQSTNNLHLHEDEMLSGQLLDGAYTVLKRA